VFIDFASSSRSIASFFLVVSRIVSRGHEKVGPGGEDGVADGSGSPEALARLFSPVLRVLQDAASEQREANARTYE
jgi:hypothetical protein